MNTWGGDRRTLRVSFSAQAAAERDYAKAERARRPTLRGHLILVGRQRYMAYSADDLITFEPDTAKPGHPV